MPKVVVTDTKGLVQETGSGFALNGGEGKPGVIEIASSADGSTTHYLWVDSDGKLRIHDAAPANFTEGTIVGTQAN